MTWFQNFSILTAMDRQMKARLGWVNLFLETKNAGYVCMHCGISRPTLRKWVTRYQALGLNGLIDQSKRPKSCSNRKVGDGLRIMILSFRNERNLGARRIQAELKRLHNTSISLATIHKVLVNNNAKPIRKLKRKKKFIRYSRSIPGDRVQIDTCKIGPNIYQYTAVDDCSRFRILEIYKRRTAENTLKFIDKTVRLRDPKKQI